MSFSPLSIRLIPASLLAAAQCRLALAASEAVPATQPAAGAESDAGGIFTEMFFLKMGFSFMVGLAMGFALKVAFKIALLVIGITLLGIFGMQYAGLIDVNWSGVEVHYDGWADWLSVNGSAFLSFVGDNLTSTASFVAGLAVGLKL